MNYGGENAGFLLINGISKPKASASILGLDLSSFSGEWVAIEGGRIIAHGERIKSVYSKISADRVGKVLFTKVPGNETMIL